MQARSLALAAQLRPSELAKIFEEFGGHFALVRSGRFAQLDHPLALWKAIV
jgi:hypothetical protein